jgi:hypothetical protein
MANVPKTLLIGQSNDSFTEIKRKVLVTHELINLNHTIQFFPKEFKAHPVPK